MSFFFFFFNDTATTEIYTLSLHDALPILRVVGMVLRVPVHQGLHAGDVLAPVRDVLDAVHALGRLAGQRGRALVDAVVRSEEHTSELQSQSNLVCRLLLEKKKMKNHSPLP